MEFYSCFLEVLVKVHGSKCQFLLSDVVVSEAIDVVYVK